MAEALQPSFHHTVRGNTASPFSTQINYINSSGSKPTTNEKIKKAIGARLGSKSRERNPDRGTCEWLGKIQNFKSWIRDEPESCGLLWMFGRPSKGKSHLSTNLVTRLGTGSMTSPLGNDRIVLSYFCDANNVLHSTELAVVLGLLNQLLEEKNYSDDLYQVICPKFSSWGQDLFSGAHIQDLWDCLWKMIQVIPQRPHIYIVLDGLDECDESSQSHISSEIRKICDKTRQDEKNPVKAFISSRPLQSLLRQTDLVIDLDAPERQQWTNRDISIFVRSNCRLQQGKDKFCTILTDRAEGTFLWVALAISLLKDPSIQQEIVDGNSAFLDKLLPVGLDAMYNRMLSNIMEDLRRKSHRQEMMRIFRCLTVSQRPLTKSEIGILTEVNDSIVNDALSTFNHILSITEEITEEETVKLIHLSLREYLAVRSSRIMPEGICWSVWPFLSSTSDLLRKDLSQLWELDYVVLAIVCFHFQGLLRQYPTLGFVIFSLTLFQATFLRRRSSLLIDLTSRAIGRLMTKSLMVTFCVKKEQTHPYLFERCIAVMSDGKNGLKREIHDAESPRHPHIQLNIKDRWRQAQYSSHHLIGAVGDLDIMKEIARGESKSELTKFLYDAGRFLLNNIHVAEIAPLQLYYTGLVFAPLGSIIRKAIRNRDSSEIHITKSE